MNERARALDEEGRFEDAIRGYERAAAADPSWSVPAYNLGLAYKYCGRWQRSLEWSDKATRLNPGDEGAWWNLGIAATALGLWDEARRAWRGSGLSVPDGEGPLDMPCGRTPVRLNPNQEAEVVWCQRLDPARSAIESIPLPESGYRWGDVVLNDGAPNGHRMLDGKEVPVFDCLELLESSLYATFLAEVTMEDSEKDMEILAEMAFQRDGSAEDWTTSIQLLCRACSEGTPHEEHPHEEPPPPGAHRIALAARNLQHVEKILADWRKLRSKVKVQSLEQLLDSGS
jgi:tetratricopeptide (TPR) repeat protein